MADPLSLSASIVALLKLSSNVFSCLSKVHHAHKERRSLLSEVSTITGLLHLLKDQAEREKLESSQTWALTVNLLLAPCGPLDQLKDALEILVANLVPSGTFRAFGNSLKWPFQQQDVLGALNKIERQKTLLLLALENDHKSGTHHSVNLKPTDEMQSHFDVCSRCTWEG